MEHPNICTVHEIGETRDGQLYIVMACYDGVTLDTGIANGRLHIEEAVRIALEVAGPLFKAEITVGLAHRRMSWRVAVAPRGRGLQRWCSKCCCITARFHDSQAQVG